MNTIKSDSLLDTLMTDLSATWDDTSRLGLTTAKCTSKATRLTARTLAVTMELVEVTLDVALAQLPSDLAGTVDLFASMTSKPKQLTHGNN